MALMAEHWMLAGSLSFVIFQGVQTSIPTEAFSFVIFQGGGGGGGGWGGGGGVGPGHLPSPLSLCAWLCHNLFWTKKTDICREVEDVEFWFYKGRNKIPMLLLIKISCSQSLSMHKILSGSWFKSQTGCNGFWNWPLLPEQ